MTLKFELSSTRKLKKIILLLESTKGTVSLTTLIVAMVAELGFILLTACMIITKCKFRRQVQGVLHKTTQSISRHLPSIAIGGGRPMSISSPYKRNQGSVSLLEDSAFDS